MDIYSLVTIIEVLCINTFTAYKCARKRKPRLYALFSVSALSIAVTAGLYFIVPLLPDSGKGNGLFMLFGFIYIIPLYFLLGQPMKHLIIVMSSAWIYTMFAFSFSFQAGSAIPTEDAGLSNVIIQTLFFALTLPYYIKLVNNIFLNILKKADSTMSNSLVAISLSWFFILFLANYLFVEGSSYALEFVLLFVIILNAILSYKLSYKLASVNIKAKELSQITKIDMLTQLKNREGFYEDVNQKLNGDQSFSVVLADLDNFKTINDTFGHAAGDKYLLEFVKAAGAFLSNSDGFYRLHGDEFVFLVDSVEVKGFCKELERLKFAKNPVGLTFKGLSLGYSTFPLDSSDLSQLLHLADLRMYQRKKEKHRLRMK